MALGPCLAVNAPGRLLKSEVAKALSYLGDPELSWAVHRAALDFDARAAECTAVQLESEIKDTSWKPYETIAKSKTLLDIEPSNTSTWFDLGQAYSSLKQTIPAIDSYSGLLRIDPRDRQASIATERASYELNPQLNPYVNFFRQRGRDGLAQIERTTWGTFARIPCRNEDEYLVLGYARNNYRPSGSPVLQGNILSVGGQGYPAERLFLYGLLNYEDYPDRFQDRVTFDIGTRYDCSDTWKLRASTYLNNVAENGESMIQDIHRYGFRLGTDYKPARRWDFSGTYTYGHYSDENDFNELFLQGAFTMCFAPQQLKFVLSSDMYGYRESTIRQNPNNLIGAVHPYFSPSFYCYYEGRVEWTQWIGRDYFAHSNQCWYSLQYGLGWDNSFNNYNVFRIIFNFDIKPWLSVGADGRAQISNVYDAAGIFAYVIVRMPFSIR